ncbi:GntR family transcriptional regulator [Salinicoccus sp. YB14-2]|uniref:GntR family transcriptional regulator n=1 Tax=Salinicoccus sp. YB14-2 TaxID=1572701 RepID=UPI00068EC721|nr:GntR family transcriptional regulator [Salinicoccus sp. YB14-2]
MKSDAHLYAKITNEIRHQIDSGKYLSGDKLPPERKLCEAFGVSRITIRQALEKLEDLNIIARKQGKGTYILPFEYGKLPEIFSRFTNAIDEPGECPGTKMLDIVRINSDKYLNQKMGLTVNTPVYKLTRLRMADVRPLLLEYSFIPYNVAPDLDRFNFGNMSLYQVLEQEYSVKIDQAFETLNPIS